MKTIYVTFTGGPQGAFSVPDWFDSERIRVLLQGGHFTETFDSGDPTVGNVTVAIRGDSVAAIVMTDAGHTSVIPSPDQAIGERAEDGPPLLDKDGNPWQPPTLEDLPGLADPNQPGDTIETINLDPPLLPQPDDAN